MKYQICTVLSLHRRQETASSSSWRPSSVLQAVEMGLLQGLVDVEVGALAYCRLLGHGLRGVGAGPGDDVV